VKVPATERLGSEFRILWTASGSSAIGDGVALAAAPLLASTMTSDPRLIAGVTTVLTLPYVIFGLPVGVLVDRLDRRRSMAIIDFIRGCVLLGFTLLVLDHHVSLAALYGCFFVVAAFDTFFRNATQAITPKVVPQELLLSANTRIAATETTTIKFIGPLCGAAMFVLAPSLPFAVDAASFFVSWFFLSRLRLRMPSQAVRGADHPPLLAGILKDIHFGIRWLLRHSLLFNLNIVSALANLVASGAAAVLVVYTHRVLGLGSLGYGVLLACEAVGAVAATRLSPLLVKRMGREWALVTVFLIMSVAFLTLWLTSSRWTAGAALMIIGFCPVTFNVVVITLRQTLIPDNLQGRVNSMYRLVAWGSVPIGATLAGLVSFSLGPPRVYALGTGVLLATTVRLAVGARRGWIRTVLDASAKPMT
jgi:MFS family permease